MPAGAVPRLDGGRKGDLPAQVRRPAHDRAGQRVRVAHLGIGATLRQVVTRLAGTAAPSLGGCLAGHVPYVAAEPDQVIRAFVERTIREETLPFLPRLAGMEGEGYLARSLLRVHNVAIQHLNQQIATDTSQMLRQRVLDPVRAARQAGRPHGGLTMTVAAWVAYLAASYPACGARRAVSDPVVPRSSGNKPERRKSA